MKKILLGLVMLVMTTGLCAQEKRYIIPEDHFNVALKVMDNGFAGVFGLFRKASGSFEFESTTKSISNLHLTIDGTSLIANSHENEQDLHELLGIRQSTEISFASEDSVSFVEGKADIRGTLSLRGIKKPVVFEATLNHSDDSVVHGVKTGRTGIVGLSMRTSFKRAEFGLVDKAKPSHFGDKVTLLLEAQAVRP